MAFLKVTEGIVIGIYEEGNGLGQGNRRKKKNNDNRKRRLSWK